MSGGVICCTDSIPWDENYHFSPPFGRIFFCDMFKELFQASKKQIQVSNEKNPACFGYIGDEKLPSYIGIIINHCKDPY